MSKLVLYALAATAGTWLITAAGAATVLFFKSSEDRLMNVMLGFAAGVMIAASFWSLLEPAVERAEAVSFMPPYFTVTLGFLSGAAFMRISDKAASAVNIKSDNSSERLNRIFMLVFSITLHNIPEGLAIGVAFGALNGKPLNAQNLIGAITIAVGIGIQNFPEGAAVSLPLRREGYSRKKSFLIGQASAIVEPVSGVIGAALVVYTQHILPYALSFAAGAMILVAVHELIPECSRECRDSPYTSTGGIILGFAAMTLLDVMLG